MILIVKRAQKHERKQEKKTGKENKTQRIKFNQFDDYVHVNQLSGARQVIELIGIIELIEFDWTKRKAHKQRNNEKKKNI